MSNESSIAEQRSPLDLEILTKEHVAELLHCSIATIQKLTNEGVLQSYSLPSTRRIYYKRSEVIAAMQPEDRTQKSQAA
jgi:hypothetical protein